MTDAIMSDEDFDKIIEKRNRSRKLDNWISVEDEPIPTDGRRYQVTDGKEVDMARACQGTISTYTYSIKPTHWQELPEPPEVIDD